MVTVAVKAEKKITPSIIMTSLSSLQLAAAVAANTAGPTV